MRWWESENGKKAKKTKKKGTHMLYALWLDLVENVFSVGKQRRGCL